MVSLYKYPSFSDLISLLLVEDPPAKAAIDVIGSRISNKKIKVKKELNTKSKNFLNELFHYYVINLFFIKMLDARNYIFRDIDFEVKKSGFYY